MKKLVLGLLISLLMVNPVLAATTVSVTAHTANTTALSATENTNNSNLANGINTHNAATTGEHGVTGTIVGTSDTQTFSNKTTGDLTWTSGAKAIFGNASRYLIDDTTVYGIEFSTHVVIPQGGKLYFDGGSTRINMTSSSNSVFDINDSSTLRLRIGSTGLFYVAGAYDDTTGGSANMVVTTGGLMSRSTSARKYKTNERDLVFDKDKFMKLKPILYNSLCKNDDKKKDFIGIVADDALSIYPELVVLGTDNQPEGFNYERLTVVLLKAIQEQQKEIDALTKRIEKLEAK